MLFLAKMTNNDNVDALKRAHYDAHIDYLKGLSERVLLSASAQNTLQTEASELIWIIEAESMEEADRVVRQDPFWTAGIRKELEISYLHKSIPERRVLI